MITLEKKGPIAILTLNRPDAMNALGEPGDGEAVRDVCNQINADKSLRCAILTGAGKGFSAGGNVKAMRDRVGSFAGNPAEVRDAYKGNVHMVVRALYGLEIPLIAAVNGAAIGLGCDVACMADIRISSDKAVYGVTFLKMALTRENYVGELEARLGEAAKGGPAVSAAAISAACGTCVRKAA